MKYWLFDGKDVLGPFTLQALAARTDFSATSLICAGETGEESDGWQLASSFDVFRFHPVSGQLEGVFLPGGQEVSATEIPAEEPQSQKTEEKPAEQPKKIEVQPTPRVEKTVEEPATVMLASEDVDLILPEHPAPAETETPVTPAAEESPAQTQQQGPQEKEQPVEKPAAETPKTAEPETSPDSLTVTTEEEIISTCTLPLVNEILERSDLPQLPQDDFEPVPLPDAPEFELKEISAEPEGVSPTQENAPVATSETTEAQNSSATEQAPQETPQPEEPQELTASAKAEQAPQEISAPEQPVQQEKNSPEEITITAPRPPREQTISRLEQALATRQTVPGVLERQTPTHKKAYTVLWILLGLILILSLAIWGVSRVRTILPAKAQPASAVSTTPEVPAEKPAAVVPEQHVTAESVMPAPEQPIAPPKPVTAQDKALAAVQNYSLPNDKGTIAAYFDRVYQDHLSQGYTASWSVEPLHKSIYIVKYRLTKTRTEPIVYVFQADGVRGKLTGALNNIALDLVGRINQN